jgi:hypothetical protein
MGRFSPAGTAPAGLGAAAVLCLTLSACGGGGATGTASGGSAQAPGQKGGTLYILNPGPHNGLDPSRPTWGPTSSSPHGHTPAAS